MGHLGAIIMVEFKGFGSTFPHWGVRVNKSRWGLGWSRRSSKSESMLKSENSQSQPDSGIVAAPQHPPLHLPSPGLGPRRDSPFYHVSATEAQEDIVQPGDDTQKHFIDSEPCSPTQGSSNTQTTDEAQSETLERDIPPPKHDRERLLDAREAELWGLYKELNNLSARRIRLRQSRMALKFKREAELEQRVSFMRHLSVLFANMNHPEVERLRTDYDSYLVATEEYLRLENDYRQEEDDMEEHEYLVSVSMDNFERSLDKGSIPDIQADTGPSTPLEDDQNPGRTLPHCVISYLSRVGDERILQERLAELESEWLITIDRQAQRRHLNMTLDKDSEEFLASFDKKWAKAWQELNNAQMDVSSLHMVCLDNGHSGFDYEDLSALNPFQYAEEPILQSDLEPLNLPPFDQTVFPDDAGFTSGGDRNDLGRNCDIPTAPSRRVQSFYLQQCSPMPPRELTNKWLLHQLRISQLNIRRLHRSPLWQPLRDQGWHDYHISWFILETWFSDEAALAPTPYDPSLDDDHTIVGLGDRRVTRERPRSSSLPSSPRVSARKLGLRHFRSADFKPPPTSQLHLPTFQSSMAPCHGSK